MEAAPTTAAQQIFSPHAMLRLHGVDQWYSEELRGKGALSEPVEVLCEVEEAIKETIIEGIHVADRIFDFDCFDASFDDGVMAYVTSRYPKRLRDSLQRRTARIIYGKVLEAAGIQTHDR